VEYATSKTRELSDAGHNPPAHVCQTHAMLIVSPLDSDRVDFPAPKKDVSVCLSTIQ
jgi:hypothetical protein